MAHSEVRACCVAEDGEDRAAAPLSRDGLRGRAVFVLSCARRSERPLPTDAVSAGEHGQARVVFPSACGLTFDMRGDRQPAKPDVGRPLD